MISDRVSSLVFLCTSIFFFVAALRMPFGRLNEPGPGLLPVLLGILMVVTSGALVLQGFFRLERSVSHSLERASVNRMIVFVLGLALYCLLLPVLGFFTVTLLFEIGCMKLFGVTKWRTILSVAIAATLGAYYLFDTLLQIPFPRGVWSFWN